MFPVKMGRPHTLLEFVACCEQDLTRKCCHAPAKAEPPRTSKNMCV